jgi:hypothetical protein
LIRRLLKISILFGSFAYKQARLLYVSPDRAEVHVGFHDEPLLALAALNIFAESADKLVIRLSNELRHTALGPIGEIAAMLVRS